MDFKHLSTFTLVMIMSSFGASLSSGQQQIKNPGFEDWEEIRSEVEEPVHFPFGINPA